MGEELSLFTSPLIPSAPRLFLLDGYALVYRAFYALIARPLRTSRGENTSAAWGIVQFLQRLRAKHHPEYLAWVNDSGRSFREDRFPAYKATRQKLSEELQADFDRGMERICDILEASHVPIVTLEGFEADDVIGTLAGHGVVHDLNVVIVSGDKDFQQLVRPGVWLLNPGRGGPAGVEEQWVGVTNGADRLGVPPDHVTDYLALVGDTSDNVPGVPGIGEKTARELVGAYGDLESILAHAPEIAKKRPREALLQYGDQARLSKDLVTIRTDLPLTLDLDRVRVQQPDAARLRTIFVELEFHTLARDLIVPDVSATGGNAATTAPIGPIGTIDAAAPAMAPAMPPAMALEVAPEMPAEIPPPVPAEPTTYRTVDTLPDLERLVARMREVGSFAFDTETVIDPTSPIKVDPLRSTLVAISVAVARGEAYYLPFRHQPPAQNLPPLLSPDLAAFRALLEDPAIPKTAQNAKYDLLILRRSGVRLAGLDFDPMIASYVLDPGRRSHGLDALALEFLQHRMTTYEELCGRGKTQITFDAVTVDCARDYSCEDADMTLRLRGIFEPQLADHKLVPLLRDIEIPLVAVLAEMEWTGITIDVEWFRSLKTRFQRERERIEREIYEVAGVEFNINSNPQLRSIMFEKLQMPIRKRTPTGPSTDASVLQELAEEGHALPSLLLDYRELFKLEGTYLDALPGMLNPADSRLHTSFNQTVASTGRLSSTDPNLQNIPIRRELGRDIRRGFVPRSGWMLLGADYSQIELRLLAHLSHDPAFVDAFRAGGDIHRQTASIIFGASVEDVTPEMRARAKTINFATIYGQGPHALSRQLKIEYAEAKAFIATYFERFQGVRAYLDSVVEFAREQGYVETLFGRRRYIPELRDRNHNIRSFGERTAQNSPIQGSAADLIKVAMIRIHGRLAAEGFEGKMLLQVHDELVFEAPEAELDDLRGLVIQEMVHAAELSVPLVVDVDFGRDWLETKSV